MKSCLSTTSHASLLKRQPNSLGKLVVRQDLYSQSYFYYTNFAASVNVPSNGIGPLDPNTKNGGYTLLNARVEWNNIAGSMFHAAAYVRNMLKVSDWARS
jgi:hypothetical protein